MIRFGAIVSVVAVAIGLLVAGAVWGDLRLVYVSIGLAALALLMLVVGVAVWRDRVFGGASAPTPTARPDAYAAGIAGPDQPLSDAARQQEAASQAERARQAERTRQADRVRQAERARQADRVRQPETARRADGARRVDPAAQAGAARAELGEVAERKTADPRVGRQALGAASAQGGRPPASEADDWTAGPGPWNRDKREPSARPPVPQGQPVSESAATGQTAGSGEAVAASKPEPERPEPTPAGAPDVADDPTRLARRLGVAAELPQKPGGPSTAQSVARRTSANPRSADLRSADPLSGPPPTTSAASGRTRLQKEAAAAAAAKSPVPSLAGPDPQAKAASAKGSATEIADAKEAAAEVADAKDAAAQADGAKGAVAEVSSAEAASADASAEATSAEAAGPTSGDTTAETGGWVSIVPGIARYHVADCILIRFLSPDDLETMTEQAAEAAGCVPCRACRPGKAAADD